MPPAPGKRLSHLIVGTESEAELYIIALPTHTLVCKVSLTAGMRVQGLAADPYGKALVVCTVSGGVDALEWPLLGMPPLE